MSQVTMNPDPRTFLLPSRTSPIIDLRVIRSNLSQSGERRGGPQCERGRSPRLLRHISRGGGESETRGNRAMAGRIPLPALDTPGPLNPLGDAPCTPHDVLESVRDQLQPRVPRASRT